MLFHSPAERGSDIDDAPTAECARDAVLGRVRLRPGELRPSFTAILGGPDIGIGPHVEFLSVWSAGDGQHATGGRMADFASGEPGWADVNDIHALLLQHSVSEQAVALARRNRPPIYPRLAR